MQPELADFEGEWAIARRITQAHGAAVFTGTARFTPAQGGLAYHEEGVLTLPGVAPMRAERDYLWRGDGDRIAVLFADGRAFHHIGAEAAHWCDPDDYRVRYDFTRWPEWRTEWQVRGPRKDYRMVSTYSPLRAGRTGATVPA